MTQRLYQFSALALLTLGAIGAIYLSTVRTASLDRIATCVQNEAKANDYRGNPNSPEAWATFAPLCN